MNNISSHPKTAVVRAPGRVEILGNHVDYNHGVVLSAAINRGITGYGERLETGEIHLSTTSALEAWAGNVARLRSEAAAAPAWANYVIGVLAILQERGIEFGGMSLHFDSDLPIGAGLSSSAALEVATAALVMQLYPFEMEPLEIAKVCQQAEIQFSGVQCGLLDQISVAMSRAGCITQIDFQELTVRTIPMPPGVSWVIINSGVKHALTSGDYNERRSSCEEACKLLGVSSLRHIDSLALQARRDVLPAKIFRRALHVTGEIERAAIASNLLKEGKTREIGGLMEQSHKSSQTNFENSCPELDLLVVIASRTPGYLGARLSGGGFGGATINLVETQETERFVSHVAAEYRRASGIQADFLVTEPCDGALVSGAIRQS